MKTIIPYSFVEAIGQDNIKNYLFKIERCGMWFETQDCKPFISNFEYRKVDYIEQFVQWLKCQPIMAQKQGCWEEVTEIWRFVKRKSLKDRQNGHYMVLVWSKKLGWIDTTYAGGLYNGK